MRRRIARGPVGARYAGENGASGACSAAKIAAQPSTSRTRPAWNGSKNDVGLVVDADEEVTGHPDAVQPEPDPPPDLDHQDAQRDRDPEPAVDDVVEQRVARVRVVVGVARRSPSVTNSASASAAGVRCRDASARDLVEPHEPLVEVQARDARDRR